MVIGETVESIQVRETSGKNNIFPEVSSSVKTLLGKEYCDPESETITYKELLGIKSELESFKPIAEKIYNDYYSKLSDTECEKDNGGAFCTIADRKIEKAFRKFVKESTFLKDYVVIGEEYGVETGEKGRGQSKYILIDPIDCTDLFVAGKAGSGTIIGVYCNGVNIAGMTLDTTNGLEYIHYADEFEVKHDGRVIKSRTRKEELGDLEDYEDNSSGIIIAGKENKDIHLYNSCKGENWKAGDAENMQSIFEKDFGTQFQIVLKNHRSVSALNSALGFNGAFVHYGTSAHDLAHMIGFSKACGGIITDHNGRVMNSLDLERILQNYIKGEKLKKEAKKLQRSHQNLKKIIEEEQGMGNKLEEEFKNGEGSFYDILKDIYSEKEIARFIAAKKNPAYYEKMLENISNKSKQNELEYRNYIYTFPLIISNNNTFHQKIIDTLQGNFQAELDGMQNNDIFRKKNGNRSMNFKS